MKKLVLLVTLISFSGTTFAAEPLLLEPLTPAQLGNTVPTATTQQGATPKVMVQGTNGVYEATYTPQLGANMVPQNAAAEGKPVPEKRQPRVKIRTKQRSQGNSYWNPGGKGTKSYF